MQLFKTIRKNKKWTAYRMSKELGISQTSLNHYEAQPATNREKLLIKLQELSELPIDQFWALLKKEVEK
jgi:transcriptional regulator with XRE-family HTH domain